MSRLSNGEFLLSAGIDIGTTTTHLTLSRLYLSNRALLNQAPRLAVSAKEIVYQSPIHFTPSTDDGIIDAPAISRIVSAEYEAAGVSPEDVSTGAVIVTGETACMRNAGEIAHQLSRAAGKFVVASAGPNLEGILAGRGSGAAEASAATGRTICNIDVGGGTANIAVFAGGEAIDAAALAIGCRCMRLSGDGKLLALSASGELLLNALAKDILLGSSVAEDILALLGNLLAEAIIQYPLLKRPPQISERLLLTDSLRRNYAIDQIWFSGGVAELMRSPPDDPLIYEDMGAYLAAGLLAAMKERALAFHIPDRPIRATVIGAGTHTLQLSGSTISADAGALPIRDLPIIRPFPGSEATADLDSYVLDRFSNCLRVNDLDWPSRPLAVVLEQFASPDFGTLDRWAAALASAFVNLRGAPPFVLVAGQDVAMALGQLMRKHLGHAPLVVLDGIKSVHGDYVDIGLPLAHSQAIPVVIKSLIFNAEP